VRCRFPASRLGAPLCDVCVILFCFSFSAAVFSRRPVCLSVFEALLSLLSQLLLTLYRLNYVFSLLNEKKRTRSWRPPFASPARAFSQPQSAAWLV
jgi:hypothetical protein